MGMILLSYLVYDAFVGIDLGTGMHLMKCGVSLQTTLLPLFMNLSCNNYVELRCMLNYL
jgi:hypothetical protein